MTYIMINDRIKLELEFSPKQLQLDLDRLEKSAWTNHFVKQNYDGNWSVIALRGPANVTHPVMMIYSDPNCINFANTPFLEKSTYFKTVLKSFYCPLLAVRLMKLSSGSRIKEHSDHDLAVENGTVRLHIPIVTNKKVKFKLNGTRVILNEGECWYLRLSDPHSVENYGNSDRVHLVIDAKVNPWLKTQLGRLVSS